MRRLCKQLWSIPSLTTSTDRKQPALQDRDIYLGGKDFYGKQFYNSPNIGAVDDLSRTSRYAVISHR